MRVISGSARSLKLKTLDGLETRPTTDKIKETLFNIIQPYLYDCVFLDLFAGSGAIGIEALSRGAKSAVFVDRNPKACACIRENLEHTHLEEGATVIKQDVLQEIPKLKGKGPFDFIYMDPPYKEGLEKNILTCLFKYSLLSRDGTIIVEADLKTDFDYADALGFTIVRTKRYRNNKHVFLELAGGNESC